MNLNDLNEQPEITPVPVPEMGEIRVTFPIDTPVEDVAKLVVRELGGSLTDAVGVECIRSLRRALDESQATAVRWADINRLTLPSSPMDGAEVRIADEAGVTLARWSEEANGWLLVDDSTEEQN